MVRGEKSCLQSGVCFTCMVKGERSTKLSDVSCDNAVYVIKWSTLCWCIKSRFICVAARVNQAFETSKTI